MRLDRRPKGRRSGGETRWEPATGCTPWSGRSVQGAALRCESCRVNTRRRLAGGFGRAPGSVECRQQRSHPAWQQDVRLRTDWRQAAWTKGRLKRHPPRQNRVGSHPAQQAGSVARPGHPPLFGTGPDFKGSGAAFGSSEPARQPSRRPRTVVSSRRRGRWPEAWHDEQTRTPCSGRGSLFFLVHPDPTTGRTDQLSMLISMRALDVSAIDFV